MPTPISFASAPGNIFNILGRLGTLIKNVRTHQLAQLTAMTDTTIGVVAQFDAESDIQAMMGSAYIGTLSGVEGVCSIAQGIAEIAANRIVFRANPRISQTLQGVNIVDSWTEIIREMRQQGASVLAMTITGTPSTFAAAGSTGDGAVNVSVKRPLDGLVLENIFAEDIQVLCTSDSYIGGAIVGNEGFTLTGVGAESDVFAFDWPLGSDGSLQLNAIDGASDDSNGNLLTNSGYDAWTANVPDNWTLEVGTAGTNVAEETTIVFDGAASMRITGDAGGTLTELTQLFDDATGTSGAIDPLTQVSYCVWARRDGVAAAAGTWTIDLVDGFGNVVLDENSVLNSVDINLGALTVNFQPFLASFRTPLIMPAALYIRTRLSVALTNGRSVYFDKGGLGLMQQLYVSGPYLAVHSGSIPFIGNDQATVTMTNSRGSGGTLSTFQTLLCQLYPWFLSSEILVPSSAVPTISDAALII